ncbi:MAG: hypothetical protein GWO04_46805, partial [Actinobacteria bacterium]|nr:hypothetical protein [Actinomycetota bacterium]
MTAGSTVTVDRVTTEKETVTVPLEYETVEEPDDSLYVDQSSVEQEGADGEKKQVIEIVYVN